MQRRQVSHTRTCKMIDEAVASEWNSVDFFLHSSILKKKTSFQDWGNSTMNWVDWGHIYQSIFVIGWLSGCRSSSGGGCWGDRRRRLSPWRWGQWWPLSIQDCNSMPEIEWLCDLGNLWREECWGARRSIIRKVSIRSECDPQARSSWNSRYAIRAIYALRVEELQMLRSGRGPTVSCIT